MKQVNVDWNLSGICSARCTVCHFGKGGDKDISGVPEHILKTWNKLQLLLGSEQVDLHHEIQAPLNRVGDLDFSFLSGIGANQISLACSSTTEFDSASRVRSLLEQIRSRSISGNPQLRFIVNPLRDHQFDAEMDCLNFVHWLIYFFALQKDTDLNKVTVAWGQNDVVSGGYDIQSRAFRFMLEHMKEGPIQPAIPEKLKKIIRLFRQGVKSMAQEEAESIFGDEQPHRISSVIDTKARSFFDEVAWEKKEKRFGCKVSIDEQFGTLPREKQIQQIFAVGDDAPLSLMFAPSNVYLHHSPETIGLPEVKVTYHDFDKMLDAVEDAPLLGLKREIRGHFERKFGSR